MKVIAFNGSPRPDGNTRILLNHVLEPIKAKGIQTEVFQLGGSNIHGCRACYACTKTKNGHCAPTTTWPTSASPRWSRRTASSSGRPPTSPT